MSHSGAMQDTQAVHAAVVPGGGLCPGLHHSRAREALIRSLAPIGHYIHSIGQGHRTPTNTQWK